MGHYTYEKVRRGSPPGHHTYEKIRRGSYRFAGRQRLGEKENGVRRGCYRFAGCQRLVEEKAWQRLGEKEIDEHISSMTTVTAGLPNRLKLMQEITHGGKPGL